MKTFLRALEAGDSRFPCPAVFSEEILDGKDSRQRRRPVWQTNFYREGKEPFQPVVRGIR